MNFIETVARGESGAGLSGVLKRARSLFGAEGLRATSDRQPIHVKAYDATELWTARLANTKITGLTIRGAKSLLTRLKSFEPGMTLEQFNFRSDAKAGSMFFDHTDGSYVGSVVVDRRPPPDSPPHP